MMFPSRLPHYLLPAAAGAAAGFRKPLYFIRRARHADQCDSGTVRHAPARRRRWCRRRRPHHPQLPFAFRLTPVLQTTYRPCSTGYGGAVALQAVAAIASGRFAAADALGRTHLAALAAYGACLLPPLAAAVEAGLCSWNTRMSGWFAVAGWHGMQGMATCRCRPPNPPTAASPPAHQLPLPALLAPAGVRLASFVLWRDNLPSYQVRSPAGMSSYWGTTGGWRQCVQQTRSWMFCRRRRHGAPAEPVCLHRSCSRPGPFSWLQLAHAL